jgi:hypothetical protein
MVYGRAQCCACEYRIHVGWKSRHLCGGVRSRWLVWHCVLIISVWSVLSCAPPGGSNAHVASNAVDLYNSATGTWSTAQLSVARSGLAAASVGNVALFAGGWTGAGSALLCRERGGGGELMVACVLSVCACCNVAVLFALRSLALSCAPLQVVSPLMLWTCTTVQQGRGRRLSSAWRASILQLHLLGTWLCSLGVKQVRHCAGGGRGKCRFLRACQMFARAAVLPFCLPFRLLSHTCHCRCWCLQCCGLVHHNSRHCNSNHYCSHYCSSYNCISRSLSCWQILCWS